MSEDKIPVTTQYQSIKKCDCCNYREDKVKIVFSHNKVDICEKCIKSFSEDFLNALKDEKSWKNNQAYMFVHSIREEEEAYDWQTDELADFTKGIWALFVISCDSDQVKINKVDSLERLERMTLDKINPYDDYPYDLHTVIIDGIIRNFKVEMKLVENTCEMKNNK